MIDTQYYTIPLDGSAYQCVPVKLFNIVLTRILKIGVKMLSSRKS